MYIIIFGILMNDEDYPSAKGNFPGEPFQVHQEWLYMSRSTPEWRVLSQISSFSIFKPILGLPGPGYVILYYPGKDWYILYYPGTDLYIL